MAKKSRFVLIDKYYIEGTMLNKIMVIKDRKTGCLYMSKNYEASSFTPLLGPDGKPIIEEVESCE